MINEIIERDKENGWYKKITPKIITVDKAINEKDLAEKNGFEYHRFPVRDFDIPDEEEFSRMVNFIKNLPKDKKIYVHCAGGYRSVIAASLIKREGFHNVRNVVGGWNAIKELSDRFTIEKEPAVLN